MGSHHLNISNTASDTPVNVTMSQSAADAQTAEAPAERARRPWAGRAEWACSSRLDIEIDQTAIVRRSSRCQGDARRTLDGRCHRDALRVLFFLASQVSQGYEVVLVHEKKRRIQHQDDLTRHLSLREQRW